MLQAFAKRAAAVLAPALAIVACYGGANDGATGTTSTPVSFYKDVEPILQAHCLGCHSPGGIAPFALDTYDAAKVMAPSIVAATQSGTMPPWGTRESPSCQPRYKWKNDPRLSSTELDTLKAWNAQKAPAGDPKDHKTFTPAPRGLQNVDATLEPQGPYTVTDKNKDSFRCFVIDPKITQTTYINGSDIVPGNEQVVHHVLLFTDPDAASKKKQLGPDGGYDCFGGVGLSNLSLVMGWVPGAFPQSFPDEIGTKIAPGTLFVMQIHYHPHTSDAVNSKPDVTKINLRFNKTVPKYEMTAALVGNFDKPIQGNSGFVHDATDPKSLQSFSIPPNAKDVTITQRLLIPPSIGGKPTPDLLLYGVGAHMHYVGTKEVVRVKHGSVKTGEPDDGNECLLDMNQWDFNWQRVFQYDAPIESLPQVRALDDLSIKCTYDNTMGNPFVAEALAERQLTQPQTVNLGEQTLDEMCLGVFQLLTPNQ
jgi:mono/diheme cytochrome c family protein